MTEAGLTAGGFYAHFASKEELFAEAFLQMLNGSRTLAGEQQAAPGLAQVCAMANRYLSPAHRRLVERGCPMPPLLAELPRQKEATRRAFQIAIEAVADNMQPHFDAAESAAGKSASAKGGATRGGRDTSRALDDPLALLALLVGGISLARGVADAEFGDRILAACRQWIATSLDQNESDDSQVAKEQVKPGVRAAAKQESSKKLTAIDKLKAIDNKKSRSSTPRKKGSLRS